MPSSASTIKSLALLVCHVLDIKPSSYYNWANRDILDQQIYRNQSELLVRVAHDETKKICGYERLNDYFTEQSYTVSKYRVRSLKEKQSIAGH